LATTVVWTAASGLRLALNGIGALAALADGRRTDLTKAVAAAAVTVLLAGPAGGNAGGRIAEGWRWDGLAATAATPASAPTIVVPVLVVLVVLVVVMPFVASLASPLRFAMVQVIDGPIGSHLVLTEGRQYASQRQRGQQGHEPAAGATRGEGAHQRIKCLGVQSRLRSRGLPDQHGAGTLSTGQR
jgi:hypothetical protein